jgi:hypothetical protein
MKNFERPAWMGPSRQRATQQPHARPQQPADAKQPAQALQRGSPRVTKTEVRRGAKGSSRGYNPYDTVTTRFPDLWHSTPKRS